MKSIPRLLLVCLLALVFFAFAAAEEPLSLPEGLRIIEEEAFADCESLSGVLVIPLSVQVEGSAFSNTPGLTVIRGIAVIGDEAEPSGGTLDWDVMTAVSAFCVERNIDFLYTSNAEDALNAGYNAIVTVGFMATDAVNALQTQYPDARFICLDSEVNNQQDNVYCVLYNTEQSGFMAGYAAVRLGPCHQYTVCHRPGLGERRYAGRIVGNSRGLQHRLYPQRLCVACGRCGRHLSKKTARECLRTRPKDNWDDPQNWSRNARPGMLSVVDKFGHDRKIAVGFVLFPHHKNYSHFSQNGEMCMFYGDDTMGYARSHGNEAAINAYYGYYYEVLERKP